jgi:hypothetical protein
VCVMYSKYMCVCVCVSVCALDIDAGKKKPVSGGHLLVHRQRQEVPCPKSGIYNGKKDGCQGHKFIYISIYIIYIYPYIYTYI